VQSCPHFNITQTQTKTLAAAGEGALLEFLKPVVGLLASIALVVPEVKNGHFHLSEEPGIGVVIDWDRLTKEKRISRNNSWKR